MLLRARQVQTITKLLQQGSGGMDLVIKENMQKVEDFLPMLAELAMRTLPMVTETVLPALR